jgi:hypothetical protein
MLTVMYGHAGRGWGLFNVWKRSAERPEVSRMGCFLAGYRSYPGRAKLTLSAWTQKMPK